MRITRGELNDTCKRRIKRLEEATRRKCRTIWVLHKGVDPVTKEEEKYVFGSFCSGRHDKAVFTIAYWHPQLFKFMAAN